MRYDYDIVVIGGGPGGYVAAIRGAQMGKKVCLVEKNCLGGVCLNQGCIPTKTIFKSLNVLSTVRNAAKFGVQGANIENCYLDFKQVQERKRQVVSRLTGGVSYLLQANGVNVINGIASFLDRNTVLVNEQRISGKYIIIATGSVPVELPIPQEGDVPLIFSEDALELTEVPGEVAIIGGGVIGIEFAFILSQLGAKVTVIELMDEILPSIDREIAQRVRVLMSEKNVRVYTGAKLTKLAGNTVYFTKDASKHSLQADSVLMAVGRKPNIDGLNLERVGIKTSKNAICVGSSMQTNIDNIYAIGDVNGKYMLAHAASMEGIVAIENLCGNAVKMDYARVPQCIYIDPEVASVGITEEEAFKNGLEIKVGRFNYAANGKAVIEAMDSGLIKVIIDKKLGEILGVHMIGAHATDMISELVLAMKLESTAEEVTLTIHPHPSIAEIIPEAFHAALHKAIHAI